MLQVACRLGGWVVGWLVPQLVGRLEQLTKQLFDYVRGEVSRGSRHSQDTMAERCLDQQLGAHVMPQRSQVQQICNSRTPAMMVLVVRRPT